MITDANALSWGKQKVHRQIAGCISMAVGQNNKGDMVDMGNRGNMGNLGNEDDKMVHSCRKRQGLVCVV